jgi:hypothetical protein
VEGGIIPFSRHYPVDIFSFDAGQGVAYAWVGGVLILRESYVCSATRRLRRDSFKLRQLRKMAAGYALLGMAVMAELNSTELILA